ncbi:hypothetical protein [Nocardioides alcanivorans]|uniref:hypothetical protein n=1 Tax=Nocardioides alcanivorans TaxID=2897352 RepID=UPI001F1E2712|nr:hypothetical protein [Nocardioides alcanivorans]
MSTLEQQLRELGTPQRHAPADEPQGHALWARGRRWHVRRRAGSVLTVLGALVLIAGLGTWSWERSQPPAALPAAQQGEVLLPDTIFTVSKWLPDLAPGQVAAINPNLVRGGWWGDRRGVAAISAATGEYGFIPLPAHATEPRLSADGRHLAYWAAGEPEGDPNTVEDGVSITAVEVRDLESGATTRLDIPSEHGLMPSEMTWVSERLVVVASAWATGDSGDETLRGSGRMMDPLVWKVGTDTWQSWALPSEQAPDLFSAVRGDAYLKPEGRNGVWVDLPRDSPGRIAWVGDRSVATTAPQSTTQVDDRGRIAQVKAVRGGTPGGLRVGTLPNGGTQTRWTEVPGVRGVHGVLGWRDGEVVVLREVDEQLVIQSIDPENGATTELIRHHLAPAEDLWRTNDALGHWRFATDVLETAPLTEGVQPPNPLDPRIVPGGTAVVVLLTGFALWRWRRVRP